MTEHNAKHDLVILKHREDTNGEAITFQEIREGEPNSDKPFDTICIKLGQKKQITDITAGYITAEGALMANTEVDWNREAAKQEVTKFQSGKLNIVADADSAIALLGTPPSKEEETNIQEAFKGIKDPEEAVITLRNALTR